MHGRQSYSISLTSSQIISLKLPHFLPCCLGLVPCPGLHHSSHRFQGYTSLLGYCFISPFDTSTEQYHLGIGETISYQNN